jgi:hypothetical protein
MKKIVLPLIALLGILPFVQSQQRPNVIFILADDLGYGDLSCLNPGSKISTPNIDRLAKEGKTFTDAHTPASLCTPTRYGILTGRYGWRSTLKRGVLKHYDPPLIEPERFTVGQLFQENAYATACIGKWHLGWDWPLKNNSFFRDSLYKGNDKPADRLRIEMDQPPRALIIILVTMCPTIHPIVFLRTTEPLAFPRAINLIPCMAIPGSWQTTGALKQLYQASPQNQSNSSRKKQARKNPSSSILH